MNSLIVYNEGTLSSTTSSLGSLIKAEDAVHTSGDNGVMALGVVNETEVDLAGTERDYVPQSRDKKGRAHVKVVSGTKAFTYQNVTNSGTIPAAISSGSVMNIGSANGTLAGVVVPPGVTIPLNPGSNFLSASSIAYDATGTNFLIQYWR